MFISSSLNSVFILTNRVLRFWPPYMNKQILLAYEIGNFRDFSEKILKIQFEKILNFEILTLYLVAVRVLSGVANLASKSHFSNSCSFRDMTF